MNGVSAGDAKMNRNAGRNKNAMGNEQILLSDHAHGHRAVGVLFGAQITLDELSRQMQSDRGSTSRLPRNTAAGCVDLVVARRRNQGRASTVSRNFVSFASSQFAFARNQIRFRFLSGRRYSVRRPSDASCPRRRASNNSSSARTSIRPPSSPRPVRRWCRCRKLV